MAGDDNYIFNKAGALEETPSSTCKKKLLLLVDDGVGDQERMFVRDAWPMTPAESATLRMYSSCIKNMLTPAQEAVFLREWKDFIGHPAWEEVDVIADEDVVLQLKVPVLDMDGGEVCLLCT